MTDWIARTVNRFYGLRLATLALVHAALIAAANHAAFWLRFDGAIPAAPPPYATSLLPLLIAVRLAVFLPLHLPRASGATPASGICSASSRAWR